MKRLLATLSVLAALAVSAVVAVPASAETIVNSHGVTLECFQEGTSARYVLKYNGQKLLEHTLANATCVKL
jgi:hypothetical protein